MRIWSDKGLLPVYRTQGGHRRYKRNEVLLWASTSRGNQAIDPISVMKAAGPTPLGFSGGAPPIMGPMGPRGPTGRGAVAAVTDEG